MLSGFNTNVKHRGVLFHVQTEDSGRALPHVITHLFHGGNIMSSEKRSYETLLQEGELDTRLKRLMEEQHGKMLKRLRSGALDQVIRERLGPEVFGDAPPADPDPEPEAPVEGPVPVPASESAVRATPEPVRTADAKRPLDEVVLDYLVESARKRQSR